MTLGRKFPEFQYDPHKRFRGWLWTLALNKVRERRCRRLVPMAQAGEAHLSDIADPDQPVPFDEADYQQVLVQRALELMQAEFQPSTWTAFWEFVVRERPAAEVTCTPLPGGPAPGQELDQPSGPGAFAAEATSDGYDFLAPRQGPDEIGRLGPYRVRRPLGAGGMGVVFEAEHVQLGRRDALKVMRVRWCGASTCTRL